MMPLTSVVNAPLLQQPAARPAPAVANGPGFQDSLERALRDVSQMNAQVNEQIAEGLTTGEPGMVETFTAVREADLAFRLMLQLRNKLVDAWQQMQNMTY